MPSVEIERKIDLPIKQVLELIEDVEAYPRFVPGVKDITDLETVAANNVTTMTFRARIRFRIIGGRIKMKAVIDRSTNTASAEMLRGPFNMAKGGMSVAADGKGTRVKVAGEYATPFDRFRKVIEEKSGVLADTMIAATMRYVRETS